MTWLFAALSTYLILAVVFLVDKYLLTQRISDPKVYTFLVGLLGGFALILIPFVDFSVPGTFQIFLSLLAGAIYIFALLWLYKGLQLFEASRMVPAITGILPLFTFGITFVLSWGEATLNLKGAIAFLPLVLGSVLITYEKKKDISLKCLRIAVLAAFFLALSFVLAKYVYLAQTFWSGFIWIRLGGVLMALAFFIFLQDVRKRISQTKKSFPRGTTLLFLTNQGFGALAIILQNWAIALAPLAYLAIINALQGTQYVFLLVFAIVLSFKFPQIIKEEISGGILFQKISAILLIGIGLFILTLR